MTALKTYEDFKNKELPELAKLRAEYDSPRQWAQLAYEEKLMEQKHKLDLKLLEKQTELMKSSNRLIAIATISAALLGAIVGAVLQYKLTQKPEVTTTQKAVPSPSSQPPK